MASEWRLLKTYSEQSCEDVTKTQWYKLVNLYKKHECLWMENHKDFYNLELKDEIWSQIALEMTTARRPNPTPAKWKNILIKWRYKVQLEQLRETKARTLKRFYELPRKLRYSDEFQFLLKHMFDRKKQAANEVTKPVSLATKLHSLLRNQFLKRPSESPGSEQQHNIANKDKSTVQARNQKQASFGKKLQALENMRRKQRQSFILSPEALHRLQ